jgi:protoporphyrinogen oxidase
MGEGGGVMKTENKITLFTNDDKFVFEIGVKTTWNGKEETVKIIQSFGLDVTIIFESGRDLNFSGLPFIYDHFSEPEEMPF